MNVKLHTPKTLKTGSGMASAKQFLLSIIATSISIALTFGTAAVVDYNKKQAAKKEMVMMVVSDFDKTIEFVEKVDTGLRECRRLQHEIAIQPELFDSLHYKFAPGLSWMNEDYSETVEKIFSTSIETFSTIGDVNFVNEVSGFYMNRAKYKENVINELKRQWIEKDPIQSYEALLGIDFPDYVLVNVAYRETLKAVRDKCMQIVNVTEQDLIDFNKQQTGNSVNQKKMNEKLHQEMIEEFMEYETVLEQAKEKLNKK